MEEGQRQIPLQGAAPFIRASLASWLRMHSLERFTRLEEMNIQRLLIKATY
jgi:hypothetical protein